MKTTQLFASVLVMGTVVGLSTSARADDTNEVSATPTIVEASPMMDAPPADEASHGKPGLVATGIVLSVLGVGHMALGGVIIATHHDCSGQWICFSDLDYPAAGISLAIGATLMAVGIPLIVYGSTAKPSQPRAQLGVSPNGVSLSGTF